MKRRSQAFNFIGLIGRYRYPPFVLISTGYNYASRKKKVVGHMSLFWMVIVVHYELDGLRYLLPKTSNLSPSGAN